MSAKGTLVTGVEADVTVEGEALCIMGTFFRRGGGETRGWGWQGEARWEGRRDVMVTMAMWRVEGGVGRGGYGNKSRDTVSMRRFNREGRKHANKTKLTIHYFIKLKKRNRTAVM